MPRNVTVTFDDGTQHVYQNAPDDITPDQVEQRAASEFGKRVTALDGGRAPAAFTPPQQPQPKARTIGDMVGEGLKNLAGGALRGAGSIGATIATPFDMIAGNTDSLANPERRARIDPAITELIGSDPNSLAYKTGKLGGEIAGTAGAGGAIANGLAKLSPAVAARLPGLIEAIRTSGMTTGQASSLGNLATRAAGGAISGGTQAAMVNPGDAGAGAVIGAAAPGVLQLAGKAGSAIGNTLRGPAQTPEMAASVQAARDAGYVIPPTQANPSLGNRLLEGFSGKITTAQNASAKNQVITNGKVAKALGLPADTTLTPDILASVRKQAGQAYDAIGSTGTITPGQAYNDALDKIAESARTAAQGFPNAKPSPVIDLVESLRSPSFDAGSAVAKIKELRSAADDAFRTGNTDIARASKSAASALESALEDHLQQVGNPEALQAFRDARQLIAKTYTVEKALNPASGTVDARKLATQLAKGKPLSGELKAAASFAAQFPKAAQPVEAMGSLPQLSPLDYLAGGGLAATLGNPLALAAIMGRPMARAATLSGPVQNNLVQQQGGRLAELLVNPALQQSLYRSAPLIGADR